MNITLMTLKDYIRSEIGSGYGYDHGDGKGNGAETGYIGYGYDNGVGFGYLYKIRRIPLDFVCF